jgi:aryl-alcohol dehydrogenase-like predicted oxidoreductase
MHSRAFGRTGLRVPVLGFGAMQLGAPRFAAYEDPVDCAIVGDTNARHVERNLAAVTQGPLEPGLRAAIRAAYEKQGDDWRGLV